MNIEIIDFYFGLFERGELHGIYSHVLYTFNRKKVQGLNNLECSRPIKKNAVYWAKYVPDYLSTKLKGGYKVLDFFQIKGYAILLEDISSIDEYLKTQLKPKVKTSILNRKGRLESCFDIQYEVITDHITSEKFSALMIHLQKLLTRRFAQRNETNLRLQEWDKFCNLFFSLINSGRASFFAIYSEKTPIALSLNYHLDDIFFGAISSYDIDYSKFGLGQILVYKRLEYCIENSFKIFDMSMGNPGYKIKWCNLHYNFNHHLVFSPQSVTSISIAYLVGIFMYIKVYLKAKNVHILYKRFVVLLLSFKKSKSNLKNGITCSISYKMDIISPTTNVTNTKEINIYQDSFRFLNNPLNEFLYATKEHISKVKVFEIEKRKTYLLKGSEEARKISFSTQ